MPIIPITDRTPEERREIARKGGRTKAENARKRQALHTCKYDDVAKLRGEVASLARLILKITEYESAPDPYDLADIKSRAASLLKNIEENERKDTARLFYGEAEAGELPPIV